MACMALEFKQFLLKEALQNKLSFVRHYFRVRFTLSYIGFMNTKL
jgi:hypothetical protein